MSPLEHNDNFEKFLREATANFKMRPSVNVWNSVYNNIHPSKKSPSLAALLVFIISFFIINHNNSDVFQQSYSTENKTSIQKHNNQPIAYSTKVETNTAYKKKGLIQVAAKNKTKEEINTNLNNIESAPAVIENYTPIDFSDKFSLPQTAALSIDHQVNQLISGTENKNNATTHKPICISVKNNNESELSYQLYATSSVGYSNSYRNTESEISNSSSNHLQNVNDLSKNLRYKPEYNLEAGGAFLVNVTSSLRLKAGMQLNYTNYKLTNEEGVTDDLNNETNSTMVNSSLQSNEIQILNPELNSEFKKYNSSTYQISIPFGTELELIGNHQLKWFAGATIQPSYLVGGYPGQNTNEMKTYFQDGTSFRKWNVNTSFETFLSFKLSNGSRINAGPQFRYQLFSSYDSKYLYNEKQYNIGLKLGISRNF